MGSTRLARRAGNQPEANTKQARGHDEHEAQRELRGDEHATQTQLPADLGRDAGPERRRYRQSRGQQRRRIAAALLQFRAEHSNRAPYM